MNYDDGQRLVPADTPSLAPYNPDFNVSLNEALAKRPELVLARQDVKFRQLDLVLQKNSLLPDVRFGATYDVNSIGTQLDGSSVSTDANGSTFPDNALRSLANNNFNTWQIFLRADIPLGFRDAHATVRTAKLNLARSLQVLKNQEYKAELFLDRQYQRVISSYELIRYQRATREARAKELQGRFRRFEVGSDPVDQFLDAQRLFAEALSAEYQAIVDYNIALANFQFAKGTILEYNNIYIAEGPLPKFAMAAAADHFEARSRALVIRERERSPEELQRERLSLPGVQAINQPVPDIAAAPADDTPLNPLHAMPTYEGQPQPQPTYPTYPTSTPVAPSLPAGVQPRVAEPISVTPERPIFGRRRARRNAEVSGEAMPVMPEAPKFLNR